MQSPQNGAKAEEKWWSLHENHPLFVVRWKGMTMNFSPCMEGCFTSSFMNFGSVRISTMFQGQRSFSSCQSKAESCGIGETHAEGSYLRYCYWWGHRHHDLRGATVSHQSRSTEPRNRAWRVRLTSEEYKTFLAQITQFWNRNAITIISQHLETVEIWREYSYEHLVNRCRHLLMYFSYTILTQLIHRSSLSTTQF